VDRGCTPYPGDPDTIMLRNITFTLMLVLAMPGLAQQTSTPAQTFAWSSTGVHFYDAPRLYVEGGSVQALLEAALVSKLEEYNLRFVTSTAEADLELSYVAALEKDATPAEIAAFHQSEPVMAALDKNSTEFEHGMVFVKLADQRTGQKLWSNTVRGLVALDMSKEERKRRVVEVVDTIMSTYPR